MSKHRRAQFTLMVTATAFAVSIPRAQNVPRELRTAYVGALRSYCASDVYYTQGPGGYSVAGAPMLAVRRRDATATRYTVKE